MNTLSTIGAGETILHDYTSLFGGWDQQTPTLQLQPGAIRDSQNFECVSNKNGGYSRTGGYERFDGRKSPSSATFTMLQVNSFTNTPTLGQTLTGNTSGATGVIIALGANYIIVTKVTGTYTNTEVLKVGATTIGTGVPLSVTLSALLVAQYTQLAADNYRADIGTVPGSGPVRGVFSLVVGGVDSVFAFRDNGGATATLLYKATTSGWTVVSYYNEISFTAGAVATPADGAILTQGGVTATVKRVMLQSGAWTGTAAGRFVITNPSGGNFAAGAASLTGGATVTLSGIQTAITMSTGGLFEFDSGNFFGQSTSIRIYGCDGENRGFEFDGDALCPITTGTSPDVPSHVRIHKLQLFFGFKSSAIHSAPGLPYNWTAGAGASEISLGDTLTNFIVVPGTSTTGTLGITTTSNTFVLYGTSSANWNLVAFNTGIGGIPFTARLLNQGYWLDDPGVMNINTTLAYGNFIQSTITTNIQDFILGQNQRPAYAAVSHPKSQYRLFWNDGTALYITIVNGKVLGMMKQVFPDTFNMAWSAMTSNLSEKMYAASLTSGYVYLLDTGSSFDGADISAFMTFNWNSMKSPRILKRFRKAALEVRGNFYAKFDFGYQLGYGDVNLIQPATNTYETNVSASSNWDAANWDAFTWDGATLLPSEVMLNGTGVNIQITISCGTNYIQPFSIASILTHYSNRRGVR